MIKDIAERYPAAARVLDDANRVLGFDLRDLMFNGPSDKLTQTAYAQPAILVASAAILAVLKVRTLLFLHIRSCCLIHYAKQEEAGLDFARDIDYAMGHSLGEYTAHYAAGSLPFEDAVRLVRKRGVSMEASLPTTSRTSMVALIMRPNRLKDLSTHLAAIRAKLPAGEVVDLSNVNSSTQAVLSGTYDAVERACTQLQEARIAARAVELPVSAPFHCRLMAPAAATMGPHLRATKFAAPRVPVISNVTMRPVGSTDEGPAELLVRQMTATVQWLPSIEYCRTQGGVRDWLVVGPNRVLANLIRKEYPTDRIVSVDTVEDVVSVVQSSHWQRS
ncbi:acyl transferase/acyl hydrolase/lysophospholipase [Blastocladiella britannica]|nr:acyl transferase/acyl hydrolase/lysophospholipase [Blastocladiella britannica]